MKQELRNPFTVILGAIILLLAAYINGYPIVYSDTSTFIASGFDMETPFDRPITYGLFLWLSSLNGISLWLVVFSQSLILSYLILRLIKFVFTNRPRGIVIYIGTMIFLAVFTSVSWTTSQLIPDIFTPIMMLSMILLLIDKSSLSNQIFLYFLFALATSMHMSHITFNVAILISILLLRMIKSLGLYKTIPLRPVLICLALTLVSISTMGSALAKSKHGFLMGALIEHGIVQKYLDEYCIEDQYELCAYKDSLPDKAWIFLWDEKSPFYKMGSWKGTKEEFNEIILNTFITPKYLLLHIKESIKATFEQLIKFKIGDGNGVFLEGTKLYERIELYYHHELSQYKSSLQNTDKLGFLSWYNKVLFVIIVLSIAGLLIYFIKSGFSDQQMNAILLLVILMVLINAWTCGTFANAIDRLGTKVIWLIPFIGILGIIKIFPKLR